VVGLAGGGGATDCCPAAAAARSRASEAMRYRSFSDISCVCENSGLGTHGGGSSSGAGPEGLSRSRREYGSMVESCGKLDDVEDIIPSGEPKLASWCR